MRTTLLTFALALGLVLPLHTGAQMTAQQPNEKLLRGLLGMEVVDDNNQTIGAVRDVLLTADDQVDQIIVGVGGFLGLGEKSYAIDWQNIELDLGAYQVVIPSPADLSEFQYTGTERALVNR